MGDKCIRAGVPIPFGTRDQFYKRQISTDWVSARDGFGMIHLRDVYCILYMSIIITLWNVMK